MSGCRCKPIDVAGAWRCWRLWYQGPPGARGLYIYRDVRRRPPWACFINDAFLIGAGRYYVAWYWRRHRVT